MVSSDVIQSALAHLRADGFLAYPTETVWGLGACADRARAIARLIEWKGRREDAPMSVLVAGIGAAESLGCAFTPQARRLAEAFWPGPLTLVLPSTARFAPGVGRADGALGLRCSAHPLANALATASFEAGLGPLTSTSLNRSGEPPAPNFEAVRQLLAIDASRETDLAEPRLVGSAAEDAGGGSPSSVVDCTGPVPKILRPGALELGVLEAVWSSSGTPVPR